MNRKQKIEALQKVFETGNKDHLQGTDKMVIHTVIVERDGWYQIVEIKPSFEVPDHELTLKEFEAWKGCIPLFPDLNNFKKIDLSTWTNEQLEARLFELENKDYATK
ncbi:MAG: hypothetical protein V4585_22995 [Bacteroidota bacterium]